MNIQEASTLAKYLNVPIYREGYGETFKVYFVTGVAMIDKGTGELKTWVPTIDDLTASDWDFCVTEM